MSWTDDRVDTLRKLWTEGLSASQIAAELGGVTRNAVIGKVHRLGLSGRAKGTNNSGGGRAKKAAAQGTFTKASRKAAGAGPKKATATTVRPAPVVDVPEPKPMMLTLLQVTEHTCKYPIGDPQEESFGFCGAKSRDGSPYCEYHCKLTYQPHAERKRSGGQSRAAH